MTRKAITGIPHVEVQREEELLDQFRKAIAPFPDWRDRIKCRDLEFFRYLETMMVDPTLLEESGPEKVEGQRMNAAKRIIWKVYLNLKAGRAPFDRGFDWLITSIPKRPMAKPRRKREDGSR